MSLKYLFTFFKNLGFEKLGAYFLKDNFISNQLMNQAICLV